MEQPVRKRAKQKESSPSSTAIGFVCSTCSRDCHYCIGLQSHTRKWYTWASLCSHRLSRGKEADDHNDRGNRGQFLNPLVGKCPEDTRKKRKGGKIKLKNKSCLAKDS